MPNGLCRKQSLNWILLPHRLRLKIYRSLGIDVEADKAGNYNKAIIRNGRKGDVHVVNIDPKFSRFFYANYLWQTMQGWKFKKADLQPFVTVLIHDVYEAFGGWILLNSWGLQTESVFYWKYNMVRAAWCLWRSCIWRVSLWQALGIDWAGRIHSKQCMGIESHPERAKIYGGESESEPYVKIAISHPTLNWPEIENVILSSLKQLD